MSDESKQRHIVAERKVTTPALPPDLSEMWVTTHRLWVGMRDEIEFIVCSIAGVLAAQEDRLATLLRDQQIERLRALASGLVVIDAEMTATFVAFSALGCDGLLGDLLEHRKMLSNLREEYAVILADGSEQIASAN